MFVCVSRSYLRMQVEPKVRCVRAHMCLSLDGDKARVFWLYTDVPDTATYLLVHLNVESIGHLVVLSNRRNNTTKLPLNMALITQFYLCPE